MPKEPRIRLTMDLGGHKFPVERDVSKPSSDPPYAADFYSVLGRIITAWGAIERTLDLTFYAARNLNSRNAISGPTTTSLGRKVKALRLAIEAYDGFKDSDKRVLGTVLDDVLMLAEQRHAIVHGLFEGFSEGDEPSVRFVRAIFHLRGTERKHSSFTLAQLQDLIVELQALDQDSMCLLMLISQESRRKPDAVE